MVFILEFQTLRDYFIHGYELRINLDSSLGLAKKHTSERTILCLLLCKHAHIDRACQA